MLGPGVDALAVLPPNMSNVKFSMDPITVLEAVPAVVLTNVVAPDVLDA